ncbi:MAG TPA: bacillithiol system redox-active protein YtxJ [Pseudomonadales bacterium]|nr:bacillithiol system redox-active protein YtxJ [Pseudomonadales bacterium]
MLRITDERQLDELWQISYQRPVLIFKHSLACGASFAAQAHVRMLLERPAAAGLEYGLVEVQKARGVSDALARRSGVRHETPQALVIREGRVVWHGSHSQVHREALESALARAV